MPFWSRKDPAPIKVAPSAPPPAAPAPTGLSCSFCAKSQTEVKKLIARTNVWICDECVGVCNEILDEETRSALPKPPAAASSLVDALERQVVGQPVACRPVPAP